MQVLDSVLLVDDDEATNYFHRNLIDKLGLAREVVQTTNGREAFEFIEEKYYSCRSLPSLVLMDIAMPDMNGIKLIKKLKLSDLLGVNKIPLAIVSLSDQKIYQTDLNSLGNFNFVTKPLSEFKFIDILKKSVIPSLYSNDKIGFINGLHEELIEQMKFLKGQPASLNGQQIYLSSYSKNIQEKLNTYKDNVTSGKQFKQQL